MVVQVSKVISPAIIPSVTSTAERSRSVKFSIQYCISEQVILPHHNEFIVIVLFGPALCTSVIFVPATSFAPRYHGTSAPSTHTLFQSNAHNCTRPDPSRMAIVDPRMGSS